MSIQKFDDFESDVTGFESSLDVEREINETSCQTAELETSTQETQTAVAESSELQIDSEVALNLLNSATFDTDKLAKFLNKILPQVEEELKGSNGINDLNYYSSPAQFCVATNDDQQTFKNSSQQILFKPDFCKDKILSSLAWNSTNVVLAVAYTENSHEGWCDHETSVGLFYTEKPQFEKEPPLQIIKVNSCIKSLKFHDHIPWLLAGGFYTGDLIVWDLKNDNEIVTFTKKPGDDSCHVDAITFLTWKENENGLAIISAGRDGKILVWRVSIQEQSYKINKKFLILRTHLEKEEGNNEHLEILSMDFQFSTNYFVVACSGGNIFYCSLTDAVSLSSFPQYLDPFIQSYKPRKGIITGVSCSNELFASCGTDSEIQIFKYDQETPVLRIHTVYPLAGLQWTLPKEMLCWGGSVVEFHTIKDANKKRLLCEIEGNITTAVYRRYGRHSRKLAVGSERGEIIILKG